MTFPRSARREVYRIIELRQNILKHLSRADLATWMRVSRDDFGKAVRELYKVMCYERVLNHMPAETPRQLQYLAAVREVQECSPRLGGDDKCVLRAGFRQASLSHSAKSYSPGLFDTMVPPILAKCPLLRKATFGNLDENHVFVSDDCRRWAVEFDTLADSGHIIVDRSIGLSIQAPPPLEIEKPSPPSDRYTIKMRVHLSLRRNRGDPLPSRHAEWLVAIRRKPYPSTRFSSIRLERLPVQLADITDLCVQQSESDHFVRLEYIMAEHVSPWNLYDFGSFAAAASTSLKYLFLTDINPEDKLGAGMSFADVPAFIDVIRGQFVNLNMLSFAISGIDTAETVCLAMLDSDTLLDGGSIKHVHVNAGQSCHPEPAFNSLRVFSRLCAPTGMMRIEHSESWRSWTEDSISDAFLLYLRSQPLHRRHHLSTVDFTTLGLTRLDQVQDLDYDEEGRPLPLS